MRTPDWQIAAENVKNMLKLLEFQQEMENAASSFRKFIRLAWPHVDPAPFVPNWHIDAIAEHLEAMTDGHIRKLVINISPRSSKSTLIAIMWPAWVWITKPESKWIFSSYDLTLSRRHSRSCRQLIKSPWYQKHWASKFKLNADSDTLSRFDNDKMGFRIATSSNSGILGEGSDYIIQDDPNDLRQMNSEVYIEGVIDNNDKVLSSRLNDRATGRRLIVQQRSSERDLTGHVLSKEDDWELLVIPMEYEGNDRRTVIGFQDPRKVNGELMCPARFGPADAVKEKKNAMVWAGQYQQRPAPTEGAKFKRHWWNFYNPVGTEIRDANGNLQPVRLQIPGGGVIEKVPVTIPAAFEQLVQGWDMAFKENKENDFISGQAWARVGARSFLLHRINDHLDFPQTLDAVRKMSEPGMYPCPEIMIEDKANGPAVIQSLRNHIPGIIPSEIDGGLAALANSMSGYCEAGNWYLPNPDLFPWVLEYIETFAAYPNGRHDDDIAACCHANRRLFDSVSNGAAPEFRVSPRPGEPSTACHIEPMLDLSKLPPYWRRWISVSPGAPGAALWFCETPKGSLRVYREMSLDKMDAAEAGRKIAEATLPDVRAYVASIHATAKWSMDILMEKAAFAPIEPIGCYAELLEHGMLNFDPTEGVWEDRQLAKQELKLARFSTQQSDIRDSAWERLRDLLRFKPADYQELPYDRKKAIELSRQDIQEYKKYMAAVEGRVEGEFPKIKFAPSCKGTIQALGASRRGEDINDCFLRALLIGVSAPESMMTPKAPKEVPWSGKTMEMANTRRMLQGRRRAG